MAQLLLDGSASDGQPLSVNPDVALALAALVLATWEAGQVRRGRPNAKAFFIVWLLCAAGFSAFAIHQWFSR